MCGIFGVLASESVIKLILDGLSKLEYRGYDSSGIAILNDTRIECFRAEGKLINLKKILKNKELKIPKKFADFKKLFNSDNFNRYNCLFLPFDAVIKALKL